MAGNCPSCQSNITAQAVKNCRNYTFSKSFWQRVGSILQHDAAVTATTCFTTLYSNLAFGADQGWIWQRWELIVSLYQQIFKYFFTTAASYSAEKKSLIENITTSAWGTWAEGKIYWSHFCLIYIKLHFIIP